MDVSDSHPKETATTQLRKQAETVRDDIRKLGNLAKDAAQEKLEEARQGTADYYGQGRNRASQLEEQLVDFVRAKPIRSVLIAGGMGMLLGIIWARR